MNKPYKVVESRLYSEVIYYDANGSEVAREVLDDDRAYDADPPQELTDEEIEDWIL